MEEILHQLTLSHYLQGFIHPRWLGGWKWDFFFHQQYEWSLGTFFEWPRGDMGNWGDNKPPKKVV